MVSCGWLGCGGVFSVLFLGYFGFSAYSIYSVVSPSIELLDAQGRPKVLVQPLWQKGGGIEIVAYLSTEERTQARALDPRTVVFAFNTTFDWDGSAFGEAELCLRGPCHGFRPAPATRVRRASNVTLADQLEALAITRPGPGIADSGVILGSVELLRHALHGAESEQAWEDFQTREQHNAEALVAKSPLVVPWSLVRNESSSSPSSPSSKPHLMTELAKHLTTGSGRVFFHVTARYWGPFTNPSAPEGQRRLVAKTELLTTRPYRPPRPVRYLIPDAWVPWLRRKPPRPATPAPLGPASRAVEGEPRPHWLSSVHVQLLFDERPYPWGEFPGLMASVVPVDFATRTYKPVLLANLVRPVRERFLALNQTLETLPLEVTVEPISAARFMLIRLLTMSFDHFKAMKANDRDIDEVIRSMTETPMWLLVLTFAVATFHLLMDLLAFKNDIAFWHGTKSLRGLSLTALFVDLLCQIVIGLYLAEEDASVLVLGPMAVSCVIQMWKVLKALGVEWETKWGVLPLPKYNAVLAATATEGKTSEYDRVAMSNLSLVLYPVILGVAIRSLLLHEHESWYMWGLRSCVSAVYTFGFIAMTPQLYVNYRLKSVAHLPWRVMMYRFVNTFTDDLFAFIIKMPTMHRLSVFRDDIIFIIYLGQRWVYPIDTKRHALLNDDELPTEVNKGAAGTVDPASSSTEAVEATHPTAPADAGAEAPVPANRSSDARASSDAQ